MSCISLWLKRQEALPLQRENAYGSLLHVFGVSFVDVVPYVCTVLVWFTLLSSHLLGKSCSLD